MTMHPILLELVEGDGQLAIIVSAVMGHLDFNPVKDEASGQAEYRPAWRFHHLDGVRRELPADAVPAAGRSTIDQADLLPGRARATGFRSIAGRRSTHRRRSSAR